jgi:hypothetical protein
LRFLELVAATVVEVTAGAIDAVAVGEVVVSMAAGTLVLMATT